MSTVLLGLLVGCGSKVDGVPANILNPRTPPDVQTKAEGIISSESNTVYQTYQDSAGSQQVRVEMKGMRLSIIGSSNLTITVTSVEESNNQCKTGLYQGTATSTQLQTLNVWYNISGLGRFQCLDKSCNYILVMIEQSRVVSNANNGVLRSSVSSVPIIFQHLDKGIYNPTDSSDFTSALSAKFLITNSQEQGAIICAADTAPAAVSAVGTVTGGTGSSSTGVINNTWVH